MDLWFDQEAVLVSLQAAGEELARTCAGLRQGRRAANQQVDPPLQERKESLLQSVSALKQLLHSLDVSAPDKNQGDGQAIEIPARHPAEGSSRLLQLPQELLQKVATLAGQDARLVCSRLRDAWSPAGSSALREPDLHASVTHAMAHTNHGHTFATPPERLARCILHKTYRAPDLKAALDSIERLAKRWPDWPAKVTSLQLSDAHKPDESTVRHIYSLLPGLRQLSCAWMSETTLADHWELVDCLPRFTALTGLTAMLSTEDLAGQTVDPGIEASTFDFLCIAPDLRSLRADLRLCGLEDGLLAHALQAVTGLTHLELIYGPQHAVNTTELLAALRAIADQLQSLWLCSPASWLLPGLADTMAELTALTSLRWSMEKGEEWPEPPCWAQAVNLRHLSLMDEQGQPDTSDISLADTIFDGLDVAVMTCLEDLRIPVLTVPNGNGWGEAVQAGYGRMFRLVYQLALQCPALTSLHLGYVSPQLAAWEDPEAWLANTYTRFWLAGVNAMQHLQHLDLCMDADGIEQLGSALANRSHLTFLELNLVGLGRLQQLKHLLPGYAPEQELARVTGLKQLWLCVPRRRDSVSCEGVIAAMVAAITKLPQLERLRTDGLQEACDSEAGWQSLVATLPPHLHSGLK